MIIKQIYINLNDWRKCNKLYLQIWHHIYKQTYQVEWGKHKWITVNNDEKWNNTIFINTTHYRGVIKLNFQSLYSKYNDKLIFISADINQYHSFTKISGLHIPYIQIDSFTELCTMISSCKLFIESLSAPLAVAHAVHSDRIIGLNTEIDSVHNQQFEEIWDNVWYE